MTYDLKIKQNIDCFAKTRRGCKLLNVKQNCLDCNFYKPKKDFELDQERAINRLKSLDKAIRTYIAEKYKIGGIV